MNAAQASLISASIARAEEEKMERIANRERSWITLYGCGGWKDPVTAEEKAAEKADRLAMRERVAIEEKKEAEKADRLAMRERVAIEEKKEAEKASKKASEMAIVKKDLKGFLAIAKAGLKKHYTNDASDWDAIMSVIPVDLKALVANDHWYELAEQLGWIGVFTGKFDEQKARHDVQGEKK